MGDDNTQLNLLVNLFQQLEASIKEDRKETNQHLEKLRENLHNLANDIHGVTTLSQMQREQIQKLEEKHESLEAALHARIDRNVAEIKKEIHEINGKFTEVNKTIGGIKPSADTITKIQDAIIRWAVPAVCLALVAALGATYFTGS